MRKIKEILRLKWDLKLSNARIAKSIMASSSTVSECVRRAKKIGLSWPLPDILGDDELEQKLYSSSCDKVSALPKLEYAHIHQELRRKGVTLQLLWGEYKIANPEGLSYSQYCRQYRRWHGQIGLSMRQHHKAGEKLFVDYTGHTVPIIVDINTGETQEAQIFVATFGASNYTYAEATKSQAMPDWISSHVRAFEYFGGVPEVIVPDNLKSGVHKAHRYEPDLNPTYQDMAWHYNVAVIPARIASPKDKPKVEQAVQNVERWILAKLRNRRFFSLQELNEAIKPLLEELNNRPFQKMQGTRLSQFQQLDKAVLRPLPQTPYVYAEWLKTKLGNDYHFVLDDHHYSVPFTLVQKKLDVRYTQTLVEIFYHGKRVASHKRSYQKGESSTLPEHMPKSHREHAKWTPPLIMKQMQDNGEASAMLAEKIISSRKQQGFVSCLGIIRLGKSYGKDRLEAACKRALDIGAYSYKSVQSILKNNLEQKPLTDSIQKHATELIHENVRGSSYFK